MKKLRQAWFQLLTQHSIVVISGLTLFWILNFRSAMFLQRYCTFQRNEPCSLPVTVEMIAAYLNKTPEEIAIATTFNALKVFGLSAWPRSAKKKNCDKHEKSPHFKRILSWDILRLNKCFKQIYVHWDVLENEKKCKVASRSTSQLVAQLRIFRLFMEGIFDAYVLYPLDKRVQNV